MPSRLIALLLLTDFDAHLPTRRIALVYWDGPQRHVAVKELLIR
jgi:hypothetical protein